MNKKLYKSSTNKMVSGVCAGLAEYFDIDPTLVRLGWAVISLFTGGAGIIGYIIALIIMPDKPIN